MIISGKQIQNVLKVYSDNHQVKKTKPDKSGQAQGKDEVVLSSQAQEFAQILQDIKNLPDVREEKVKEITERIASGNYRVEAGVVAEKMIGRMIADKMQ